MNLADPISLLAFEDAVQEWFQEAIETQAIWAVQSAPRPQYPYGSLRIISGPVPASPAFEQKTETDLTRPLGQEVEFQTRVPCTFVVSCQAHVTRPDGNNPSFYARALISRATARLYLPSVQERFRAANIAVQRTGPVTDISAIVNDGHVSRAGVDVTFNAALGLSEYTGYIAKVAASSTELGIDQVFGDV